MSEHNYDIAIIGIAGEFPNAKSHHTFWDNLLTGKECLKRFSHEELRKANVSEKELNSANYVTTAGCLEEIDLFAADFFGYSPRDAALIDPQQRKLLELAWHALEDANVNPASYAGSIGVFVGSSLNTYLLNNILSHPSIQETDDLQQVLFGNGCDYLATRIAYLFNLRGPALNIQTACSTSLVAVHEACQHLLSYQADVALAGGVSISSQKKGYLYSVDGMLSPDGHCRPFSEQAEGTVFSSGAGLVVLKRLTDALEDGDAIYAVIKSSAINNDGHQKVGYTAPSVDGQAEVISLAQELAGISPEQIGYIEAHGTATSLGDLIEASALQKVFAKSNKKQFCALGSVKSNIGHLDVAAGIAGLIKTTLALHHKKIPPTLHCALPSKKVDWANSAFYVNQGVIDWSKKQDSVRYAGVSSFGIGGTNAHAILSEAPAINAERSLSMPALLIFSAKTKVELENSLQQFNAYCAQHPTVYLHSVARTLQQGRGEFSYRTAFITSSISEAQCIINQKAYSIVLCNQEREDLQPKSIEESDSNYLQWLQQQWIQGYKIDWSLHYNDRSPSKLHLPVYPFQRARYWIEPYKLEESSNKKLNMDEWFYLPAWCKSIISFSQTSLAKTSLLLFIEDNGFYHTLRNRFIAANFSLITVLPATTFSQQDNYHFYMDFSNPEHYQILLTHLKNQQILPNFYLHALTLTEKWQETNVALFEQAQSNGLLSIIYFMQAWEKVAIESELKLTILTNRLNQVSSSEKIEPHKSPLLAAVKVIPKEYPKISTQLIDIDAIDHVQFTSFQLDQLKEEILKPQYDQEEITYRHFTRWVRDYIPTNIPRQTKLNGVGIKKVIVIAGGLGQLGLDVADYFSKQPNVYLALLSRSALPQENEWETIINNSLSHPKKEILQRLVSMRKTGAIVQAYSADVSNLSSLKTTFEKIEMDMGVITGVIHAAGETVNGIISLKKSSSLNESYTAKVLGTYHLHTLLKDKKVDFFILCSSMNAIIGGLGQLDNTAANAFIDYMAEFMATETGQPIFSINWGAININRPLKVNVLHQFMDLSTEHKKNRMTDDEVDEVYNRILAIKPRGRIVISTIDMNTVLKSWNRVASIEELSKDRKSYQQNITRVLAENEYPQTEFEAWVSEKWQQLLGLNAIGLNDNFFSLGGHSLAAVQFMTKIKETYQLKMHVMNLYELPTLKEFSNYLEQQIKQKKLQGVI